MKIIWDNFKRSIAQWLLDIINPQRSIKEMRQLSREVEQKLKSGVDGKKKLDELTSKMNDIEQQIMDLTATSNVELHADGNVGNVDSFKPAQTKRLLILGLEHDRSESQKLWREQRDALEELLA